MRKLIISLGVFVATVSGLLAQNKMLVNLKSGTIVGYTVTDVESVTWEIGEQHEYVDLGLPSGLKWATCNVGASAPEEYGDYYAWGETVTKTNYSISTYEHYKIETSTDADGFEIEEHILINLGDISGTEYDVAHQKWGGSWRMPTQNEFQELYDYCTWTWGTNNSVRGYKVTGTNGNWIFLPAAGYRSDTFLYCDGSYGYYWSSTPCRYSSFPNCVYNLDFSNGYVNPSVFSTGRCNGLSVRPVTE